MTLDNAALDVENGLAEIKGLSTKGVEFSPDSIAKPIERLMLKRLVEKVVLKADRDASYGTIEKVLNTLQKNDLLFVNMVTEVEES